MKRSDYFALFLSLLGVLASYWVTLRVFEAMPHIEDEMAYAWQAETFAQGDLTVPTPPSKNSFLVPFVVDYEGQRFGKYPPGWPAMLAVGVVFEARDWVNPLLAGLGLWLTYRLGKRLFGAPVGLLAAALTLTSPFFLMNSGSLLSHPFGLALTGIFALSWLDAWDPQRRGGPALGRWLPTLTAALSLGLLVLTRPLTGVGVALPFSLHGLYLLFRSDGKTRLRLLLFCLIVLALAGLLFLWQYAVTGDPALNPYTLWWEYDKIGFGPGVGRAENGHSLRLAEINTRFSLWSGIHDLFGWASYSWVLLPIGLIPALKQRRGGLVLSLFFSLVLVYTAYWIGSWLFGPRYYYEGLYSLTLLTALGFAFLAGWPTRPDEPWHSYRGWKKARPLGMTALLALLVSVNLVYYLPARLAVMHGLYEVNRARLAPFETPEAQALTPALVVVEPVGKWSEYGALLDLQTPYLDTPFVFVISLSPEIDARLSDYFPERRLVYYYTDEPYTFYDAPRPGQGD